eukprot:4325747-Lingulodinium_polyedra.AAC.1
MTEDTAGPALHDTRTVRGTRRTSCSPDTRGAHLNSGFVLKTLNATPMGNEGCWRDRDITTL